MNTSYELSAVQFDVTRVNRTLQTNSCIQMKKSGIWHNLRQSVSKGEGERLQDVTDSLYQFLTEGQSIA